MLISLAVLVVFFEPVVRALESLAPDAVAAHRPHKGDGGEDTPSQGLTFRLESYRNGEEATRDEGPKATTQRRQRLCNAIECAQAGVRWRRIGDLREESRVS